MDMLQPLSTPNTTITLTGLNIFTDYTIYVAATTVAGVGPADSVVLTTVNVSKCLFLCGDDSVHIDEFHLQFFKVQESL